MSLFWWQEPCQSLDHIALRKATERQRRQLKPARALGRLEPFLVQLAAQQGREKPQLSRLGCSLFVADHGVAEVGVSAVPRAVTGMMVGNVAEGLSVLSILARRLGATLEVIDLGTARPIDNVPGVRHVGLGPGTRNFLCEDAMTPAQCMIALETGREAAARALAANLDLFIGGTLGVGSSASASALACALLGCPAELLVGPGSGLDAAGVARKRTLVEAALERHLAVLDNPLGLLQSLGGFEIAALTGAYLGCAQLGVPVLVDGFVSTVCALLATRLNPRCRPWLLFSHCTSEPGHYWLLDALKAEPLLQLDLLLGDGSGAALAVPMLQAACDLHAELATLDEGFRHYPSEASDAASRAVNG